ncbi:phosphatase PAP2 family protein [Leptolyngbya sp. 15MV]|nr:phosphatase PAP2 family protein [Leptolyngbya sp. 15MV]
MPPTCPTACARARGARPACSSNPTSAWNGSAFTNARLYFAGGFALLLFDIVASLARHRPGRPARFLTERYRARLRDPRTAAGLLALAVLIAFMPFFSRLKSMIPLLNDFGWDAAFIAWDRALFLGFDAWQVMQPLLGYPPVTAALAFLYHAWILLIYLGTLYLLFYRAAEPVRRQYLIAFLLIWTIVGGAMATMFASVGPCFVGPILGDDTFAAQMAYLEAANREVPIMTLHVQDLLLEWHRDGNRGLGSGITAMPSMHVAMAMLFWLAVRRVSPGAGRFFFVFLALIWIGSVHLAYHYAVDGLVSVIATAVLWWAANRLVAWWDARAQPTLRTNTVPAE